jgi:RNA polymerase sigma factor (TIGR02999 family)
MRQAVPRPSIDTVYSELRQLAAGHLAREPGYGRLSPTSLVHVTYQRLLGKAGEGGWENRRHFFAAASEAMRRILIEQARRRLAQKRGGNARQEWLDMNEVAATMPDDDLVALNEALDEFAADEPDKAELVKLRFFAGFSETEAAAALGISRATASRQWMYSRAWLFDRLRSQEGR